MTGPVPILGPAAGPQALTSGIPYTVSADGSLPGLSGRTLDRILAELAAGIQQRLANATEQSRSDLWSGLRRGTPGDPVSLPLATIEGIAQRFLPIDIGTEFATVFDALQAFLDVGDRLWDFLGGFNPLGAGYDLTTALQTFVNTRLSPQGGLLSALSLLSPENMPNVLSGSGPLNLLINALFQGPSSVLGEGVWSAGGNEQVTTTANGTVRELQGNAIPVAPQQQMDLSTRVQWSGLTYTGTAPVSMGVAQFSKGVELPPKTLASLTSPAASGDQLLSGSYTVPADGSVDEARIQYVVSDLATAGNVAFREPSPVTQSPQGTVVGLPLLGQNQQGIIDDVWNAFDSGISGNTTGNPLSKLFDGMFGTYRTGTGAVSVNVVQDSRLDAFGIVGGISLSDTFNGASSSALNTTNWNQTYSGSGGGTCGLNGNGFCRWNTSGSTTRTCRNRYKLATLATNIQSVAISLAANFPIVFGGDPTEVRLQGRMNSAETEYVEARIAKTSVEIGYVVAGTYARFGTAVTISGDTSGTWQLKLGTLADDREFVLLHNGTTVISRTDTGDLSSMSASHLYTGFTMHAGWSFSVVFGFPLQVPPPDAESWAAADRALAS